MKHKILLAAILSTALMGCASTSDSPKDVAPEQALATGPFADCNLPTVEERGPIRPSLFVVGTFPDGQWMHMDNRQMQYKGNGIYQVVSEETAGNVSLQFATMSWNPQFTAEGRAMTAGYIKELKRGGFAKNTVVNIPEDGKYLWSIEVTEEKKPVRALIKKCN
ncbi:glycosidase [Vibrio genomosp. F6]|uniref:glycosidase n=1 Tax=Vibrio genomosp. F6 TaxID=723172 RepID=UPI0010BD99AF|nr:glycosidase [Vibrio genomosp. F6]TKF21501.1 glycosidase [Vibrio genomosp. F6]